MTPAANWVQEGREVGVTLDACHAVVVIGSDPVATCDVALGIARVQAQHRRVGVADMFGDAPPLQALVPTDDPHGLVDSFHYGVSLSRIAHQVPDAGELFILPSGTGPLDYEELFLHPRWRTLPTEFGGAGGLLVIAAPAEAPQIRALVDATDGAVLVGDVVPPDLPVARSLAWLRTRRTAPMSVTMALPPARRAPAGIEEAGAPGAWRRVVAPGAGVAAVIVLALLVFWFATRPTASAPHRSRIVGEPARATPASPASPVALAPDTATRRITPPAADSARGDALPHLGVADPQDSASAAAYAVFVGETSTRSGAILRLEQAFKSAPVPTFGVKPRSLFFLLYTGAYATRAGAESLLATLRARRVLGGSAGRVTVVPYAFLVQSDVPAGDAPARVARYRARGHPVYALLQPNGAMQLYYGAYETPQQAALAIPGLTDARLTPTLVYRVGRVH